MDRRELTKNFTDSDEKFAFAKLLDNLENCVKYHEQGFTDFLDPYKIERFITAIKKSDECRSVCVEAFGGFQDAERKIIGVSPEYLELEQEHFPVVALKIENRAKIGKELTHRDYLGSVLGLGLDRGKVGDVLLTGSGAFVVIDKSVSDYVCANLSKVAHNAVEVFHVPIDELYALDNCCLAKRVTVQSLRLDAVISAACNLSRSKSVELISGGKAFVNWQSLGNPSAQIKTGDTITLRGVGRIKVLDIVGTTKKGGTVIEIRKNS